MVPKESEKGNVAMAVDDDALLLPLSLRDPPCSFIRDSGSRSGRALNADNQTPVGSLQAFAEELDEKRGAELGREIDQDFDPVRTCISLLFLLVNEPNQALCLCKALESGRERPLKKPYGSSLIKVFLTTAKTNGLKRWDLGLACALYLLKRFRALKNIFFLSKEDAIKKFNGREHLFLEKFRVELFKLANQLDAKDSESFLSNALRECRASKTVPDFKRTETNLLQLIAEEKLGDANIAKFAGMLSNKEHKSLISAPLDLPTSGVKLNNGLVVVLNQESYQKTSGFDDRHGTKHDLNELTRFWGGTLGFKVRTMQDLTGAQIKDSFEKLSKEDFSAYDCFVLVILGHGRRQDNQDYLVGVDGRDVNLKKDIYAKFYDSNRCPSLASKLRLFITQACRGQDPIPRQDGFVRPDGAYAHLGRGLPSIGDYIIFNSTVEGYASFRRETEGSFFIQLLCRELHQSYCHHTLTDIIQRSMGHVKSLTGVMSPEYTCTYDKQAQLMPKVNV